MIEVSPPTDPPTMSIVAFLALASLAGDPARPVDFNRDVRPILSDACFRCHGPDPKNRKGLKIPLRLDTEDGATADLGDHAAIDRKTPEDSEILRRITSHDDDVMPPATTGRTLTKREIDTLTAWIKQGAPYARHWSYVKPVRPELPAISDPRWARNDVDRFVLAKLDDEGLKPSPEAGRPALIRRASLDLTGLPPTPEEVDAFVADDAPDAYERLVDRLLQKQSYGEHWGRLWLDLARYADSAGYADDPPRTIWAYRDWVVRAFNANMPFDKFTIEQIAGDLLPNATDDQRIATAFHRNTLTNSEGGTNDEEFRSVAVVDRVNTTMAVWMGTTLACAQCHDHKYDPLSQKEYFGIYAFLNNTEDADRSDETPVLPIWNSAKKARKAALEVDIPALEVELASKFGDTRIGRFYVVATGDERVFEVADVPPSILAKEVVATAPKADDNSQASSTELRAARERLAALRAELASLKPETTVPIARDLPSNARRKTNVQVRGNFLDLGPEVSEGVPAVFPALPSDAPRNRLTLAKWLVSDDNPLTARVVANRCWEHIFGTGLVATSEEFGAQGDLPSHPELLDWLATELVRERWDLKATLRRLVTSATYRQSSRVSAEMARRDPENRLLSRGPRLRLPAEMIRDQALAVAGLLSPKIGGPPVKPPQPSSGLSAAFGSRIDWETSAGEDRYRRGLYTTWRRSNPYPSMTTFDAPNRETCTLRRSRTNTPLQALVTLNDPVFVEAAQALARRMAEAGPTPADKARRGFRLTLARPPSDEEVIRLVRLYATTRKSLEKNLANAQKLATEPLGPLPKAADAVELASWTVVANVLLNLDETLMKP